MNLSFEMIFNYFEIIVNLLQSNLLELIKMIPSIITAFIAYLALRKWKAQDKAKIEVKFLDELLDATHTYISELSKPMGFMQLIKIGLESYKSINEKGFVNYIEKNGKDESQRLFELLKNVEPSLVKLLSLSAKGQIFNFNNYFECENAIRILVLNFERIQSFASIVGSTSFNWDNVKASEIANKTLEVDPEEIKKIINEKNVVIIKFVGEAYKRIYQ